MEYKAYEVKAGLLVIVGMILLFVFLFAISGLDWWSEKSIYFARFSYIGGITEGSSVRFGGLEIGKVTGVRLPGDDDPRIELVVAIDNKAKIRTDSKTYLTTLGIMGAMYVEITTGSADSLVLPPGSMLNCLEVTPFAQMSGKVSDVGENLDLFLNRLNDVLNEQNRAYINSILENMNLMVNTSRHTMSSMLANLDTLSQQLILTFDRLDKLMATNELAFSSSLNDLHDILATTKNSLVTMEQTGQSLNALIINNNDNYQEIITNLRVLTQNMEEFSQLIKEQPWNLVRKSAPKERKLPK